MDHKIKCIILCLLLGPGLTGTGQNGTPDFLSEVLDDNIEIGYGLAIEDVNLDGKPDILLADKRAFVWYRNPDWKRLVLQQDLTEHDNVCLTAAPGTEGLLLAVGARWNPTETTDFLGSGSVHLLHPPENPEDPWRPQVLPHVPTIHRMNWVNTGAHKQLVVLPLHGVGNANGEGNPVQVLAYHFKEPVDLNPTITVIDQTQHLTHNFEVVETPQQTDLYIGGKEGVRKISYTDQWSEGQWVVRDHGFGEVRMGRLRLEDTVVPFLAGIEPIHGNILSVYTLGDTDTTRQVLATDLRQGHALACADLLDTGETQIVVGWRNPNDDDKVGIRIYVPQPDGNWSMTVIDDNKMACEDLKVADLDADGDLDIIAAGRSTKNLKVYWNQLKSSE